MKHLLKLFVILMLSFHSSGCASNSLSKVYKKVDPSVVVIHTSDESQHISVTGSLVSNTERGLGTGVIISKDGQILTASHVVQTADRLNIKLADGREFKATTLSTVPFADLALIKLDNPPEDLSPSFLGNSAVTEVGDPVFVIGTPYGIEHTLTAGYISGKRDMGQAPLGGKLIFLQTDAAINKGNSGGPIFNTSGELIGIVSHIKSQSGGNEGLGFATSINTAKEQIINQPAFWSGLELLPIQGNFAKALGVAEGAGFIIQNVAQNSIGSRLGLRAGTVPIKYGETELLIGGDIITRIGKQNVYLTGETLVAIASEIAELKLTNNFNITIIRNGETLELSTELQAP